MGHGRDENNRSSLKAGQAWIEGCVAQCVGSGRGEPASCSLSASEDFPDEIWRKRWDSNPRWGSPHAGFQDQSLKPLGHTSLRFRLKPKTAPTAYLPGSDSERLSADETCDDFRAISADREGASSPLPFPPLAQGDMLTHKQADLMEQRAAKPGATVPDPQVVIGSSAALQTARF